jgi:hypothetical protein
MTVNESLKVISTLTVIMSSIPIGS